MHTQYVAICRKCICLQQKSSQVAVKFPKQSFHLYWGYVQSRLKSSKILLSSTVSDRLDREWKSATQCVANNLRHVFLPVNRYTIDGRQVRLDQIRDAYKLRAANFCLHAQSETMKAIGRRTAYDTLYALKARIVDRSHACRPNWCVWCE